LRRMVGRFACYSQQKVNDESKAMMTRDVRRRRDPDLSVVKIV
jgi:hypothetical protein